MKTHTYFSHYAEMFAISALQLMMAVLFALTVFVAPGVAALEKAAPETAPPEMVSPVTVTPEIHAVSSGVSLPTSAKPAFGFKAQGGEPGALKSDAIKPYTADVQLFKVGQSAYAAVTLTFAEGHYAYAHSPEVSKPTELALVLPGQSSADGALYPPSVLRPDFFEPQKRVPAYEGTVSLFLHLPASFRPEPASKDASLRLTMLVCSAKNCRPVTETFSLPATFTESSPGLMQRLDAALPGASLTADTDVVPETAAAPADFPPPMTPQYADPGLEPGALFTALWLGLLAGLVLNIMPCVLPVLTIKITSLLGAAGDGNEAVRFARFREHNLYFAAGILTWFILLAFAVGLLDLAWGGLFQQVGVVYALLILVFMLGLSLFDVFTLPVLDFKVGHTGSPRLQAYLSGVVVTLLATPCSGPLLGGVLGWAASQPLYSVILVFISTGLGMASPYLFLAFRPSAARLLPRPGAWTGVVERLAGFFLMGTALYLLSVLPESLRLSALGVLLTAALVAWIWGNWGMLQAPRRQIKVAILCILLLSSALYLSLRPSQSSPPWIPFTPAAFSERVGNTPLLVEFTADWCPTCKVLERTVLTSDTLTPLIQKYNLTLMKVDMTRPNPAAEALLRALGSVSIPVTAIFTQQALSSPLTPTVLRDLYTTGDLQQALKAAIPAP